MIVPVECYLPPEQDEIADTHWSFVNSMAKTLIEALMEAAPQFQCGCEEKSKRHTLLLSACIVAIASATISKLLAET